MAFNGACPGLQTSVLRPPTHFCAACYSSHLRLGPPPLDFCAKSKSTPRMDPVVRSPKVLRAKDSQLSIGRCQYLHPRRPFCQISCQTLCCGQNHWVITQLVVDNSSGVSGQSMRTNVREELLRGVPDGWVAFNIAADLLGLQGPLPAVSTRFCKQRNQAAIRGVFQG